MIQCNAKWQNVVYNDRMHYKMAECCRVQDKMTRVLRTLSRNTKWQIVLNIHRMKYKMTKYCAQSYNAVHNVVYNYRLLYRMADRYKKNNNNNNKQTKQNKKTTTIKWNVK